MVTPDQLEAAGNAVAAVYNDIEAKMLDHLVNSLIYIDHLDQTTLTELNLLAQSQTEKLRDFITDEAELISDEVRQTAESLMRASDEDDLMRMGGGAPSWPQQIDATIDGIALILARDNLKMVEGAKQAFLSASIEAVTKVNTGTVTTERALHQAVRKLEREGIPIITYQNSKTGAVTVENKVDVAVRRHIRTQIAQDSARMTMERMEDGGVTLVEVSSHGDSRPEHAKWQGSCYSLNGDIVIEGTRYPDFYKATGYGRVDGLMGANCRHSFGPYRHGMPRAYEPNPKHPSGLTTEEVYEYEQKQRYLERRIREAKREVRGAQQVHDKMDTLESRSELLKAQSKLKDTQSAMRDLIDEANGKAKAGTTVLHRKPNREWAGDMPKRTNLKASGRKLDDFLGGTGAASTLKTNGISKTAARAAMAEEMAKRGGTAADFAALTAQDQQAVFKGIVRTLRNPSKVAKAKHVAKTAVDKAAPMYASIGKAHVDTIAKLVDTATPTTRNLYLHYESDLALLSHTYTGTAHFSRTDVGVYLDIASVANDTRGAMTVWFHEFGHHIDYISTGLQDAYQKRAAGMALSDMYASIKYKGNLFGNTLKAEVGSYVDAVHSRIKAEAKARLDALDIRGMYNDGMLSDPTYQAIRHKVRAYKRVTAPDFNVEEWGMTAEEVKQAKGYKKEIMAAVRKDGQYRNAIKKDRAYEEVSKELSAMTDAQKADLSDIFGGATGNKVNGGWGHRASYWDSGNQALAKEAFAEFYSASMSNPDSLALLKQYLPKSAGIFEDIIDAIEKGTI